MSSESSEQEETAGNVRGCLLYKNNRTHLPIKVGALPGVVAEESTALIAIAELGGRFIVAIPGVVWNRKIAKRKIEKAALGKALSVDVVAAALGDPETATPEVHLRIRVGVLAAGEELSGWRCHLRLRRGHAPLCPCPGEGCRRSLRLHHCGVRRRR